MKKTALYDRHVALGGKMVEYAGWQLPVQYSALAAEHHAVRNQAGIFDVSHMGEALVFGPQAEEFVNWLVTNDVRGLQDGQLLYSPMCYPDGGVVDDLLVYRLAEREYFLVINAANIDKDLDWMRQQSVEKKFAVQIVDVSPETAEVALQGPNAEKLLMAVSEFASDSLLFFHFAREVSIAGVNCLVSRSGYTGEDGFEIYAPTSQITAVWDALLAAGTVPCGLGCRDTLRFEAALPLYGNEISAEITPLEAGLGIFVKLDKTEFCGREALAEAKICGLKRKLVGFELLDKGIPRHGYEVFCAGRSCGVVTTGYLSPTLGKAIGLALVDDAAAESPDGLQVQMRGKLLAARLISRKFIDKKYKKAGGRNKVIVPTK